MTGIVSASTISMLDSKTYSPGKSYIHVIHSLTDYCSLSLHHTRAVKRAVLHPSSFSINESNLICMYEYHSWVIVDTVALSVDLNYRTEKSVDVWPIIRSYGVQC